MYQPLSPRNDPPAAPVREVLYESDTTRVFREAASGAVFKQPLGRGAGERLRHEKDMLARLAGLPGVPRLAAIADATDVLAMEDAGEPLARMLAQGRPDLATALAVAVQLARTLEAIHAAGVIHRHVTSANVLWAHGRATLADFDLAVSATELRPGFSHQNLLAGTLAYMAPEQTGRTGRVLDHRADLYALGVVLYEMTVGGLPFESQDALELMHGHLVQVPAAPATRAADVPAALSALVMRLLEKEPAKRYQSAHGLARDLEAVREAVLAQAPCDLVLGRHDFGARLAPPSQPVGREAELAALRAVVGATPAAMEPCVLLSGPPGAGKTTLVHELRPIIAARHGWFVSASFHQHRGDAFASAATMRALGRLLLAEPEEQLVLERQRMLKALGRNLGLGATQLPEFQLLLGSHPCPCIPDPREAEARINQAALDLLRSIASARPVVMVLEDLQWAPTITLAFLDAVVTAPDPVRGLLVVGTYRPDDLGSGHALQALFARWRSAASMPAQLEVVNLPPAALGALVAEMLRQPPAQTQDLADALYERTAGNPHHAVELVNALRQEGLLRHGDGGWQWNASEVRAYVGDCSVPSLLMRRVGKLPAATRSLLEYLACLGGGARSTVLEAGCGIDAADWRQQLAPAIDDGLLLADGDEAPVLRFRHPRVQQAVLNALSPEDRRALNIGMARRLLQRPDLEAAAAEQYLAAWSAVTDRDERRTVARLFQRAVGMANVLHHGVSERYLAAAVELLEGDPAPPEDLLRQLLAARHQTLYGMGRLEEGDIAYAAAAAACTDPLELSVPAGVQMHSLAARSRYQEAMDLGLALLARLGLTRPGDVRPAVRAGLERVATWVGSGDRRADFHRPAVTEPTLLALATLMANTSAAAYFCDGATSAWLALEAQRMWSAHGPCAQLVSGVARAVTLLVGAPQDYRGAYAGSQHIVSVGNARDFEPGTSLARFSFSMSVAHWVEPVEDVVTSWQRTREDLMRAGDFRFASYTYLAGDLMFDCGSSLELAATEVEAGLAFAARSGHTDYIQRYLPRRQLIRAMRGTTSAPGTFSDGDFDEEAYVARLTAPDTTCATYHMLRTISAAVFGDIQAWAHHADTAMPLQVRTPGYYITANLRVLHAVSLAERARAAPHGEAAALLAKLDATDLQWLQRRAADAPCNYLHLLRWVEAERAWSAGTRWEGGAAFDNALAQARLHARPWHLALITERAGLFHLTQGMEASGRALLAQARDGYDAWGATGKVRQMQRSHSFLRGQGLPPAREHGKDAVSSDAMDLLAVVRASQSLSSETSVQQLRVRVAELLGAMSGASRVELVLWNAELGRWLLPATDAAGREAHIPVEEAGARGLLPLTAFRYAERTREVLLVDDATQDDRFADDPYLASLECCSLLLMPILTQGSHRAMLLLENRLSAAAFSSERLDAVRLIAGQLAVSLENALLYQELEQRVQERTRELRTAQAELVATARRAGMAEIATNVLHNVGNVLNSVNVSANLVSGKLRNAKSRGLARAVEMLDANEADLAAFLTSDEKGRLLPGYLRKLAQAVDAEQREIVEELANLTRSVEHIKQVVATQQSHAGTSSLIEPADVGELAEDALRINSMLLQRHQVTVEREFAPVPPALLDKARVMQILVNLTRNAAQAMEATPGERPLVLRIEAGGAGIRVLVRDRGVGIPPGHLTRIFAHGFTTRKAGHGFGLHSCALAAREMGGNLTASSEGPGRGATFALELPLQPPGSAAGARAP